MTQEELLQFPIYRDACPASQMMGREVINHIERQYGVRPAEASQGQLQWMPNFARIQTLGQKATILTINLSGSEIKYADLEIEDLFRPPWRGLTRVRLDDTGRVDRLLAAVDRSYRIRRQRGL